MLMTAAVITFLLKYLGPLVLGNILHKDVVVFIAFSATYSRCCLKDKRLSIMTPWYFSCFFVVILQSPALMVINSSFLRLGIKTASVL